MDSVLTTQQASRKILVADLPACGFNSLEGRDRPLPTQPPVLLFERVSKSK